MKITIRARTGVNYSTGAILNVPDSYSKDEIRSFCQKWIDNNLPGNEHWYWKLLGA